MKDDEARFTEHMRKTGRMLDRQADEKQAALLESERAFIRRFKEVAQSLETALSAPDHERLPLYSEYYDVIDSLHGGLFDLANQAEDLEETEAGAARIRAKYGE